MKFDLTTFMSGINLGLSALQAAHSGIQEVQAGDTVSGALQLIQVAGSTAAGATSDPEIQAEATAATQIACLAVPIISDFINLFKKKAAVKAAAAAVVAPATVTPITTGATPTGNSVPN